MRFCNCLVALAILASVSLSSGCCALSGSGGCDGLGGGPGFLAGLGGCLQARACSGGCGDVYIGPWISDPPACDSCSGCGITAPCDGAPMCDSGCDSFGAARGFLGMPTLFGFIYDGGCCSDPGCDGCDAVAMGPACGCEVSCGHEVGCGCEVSCGHEPGCGLAPAYGMGGCSCEASCGCGPGSDCGCGGHGHIIEGEVGMNMNEAWPTPPSPVAQIPSRTRRIYNPVSP